MILIIGGGPAGLAAALALNGKAMLLERNPQCGKKLLLSGKGQCNFTNALPKAEFLKRCGEYANWLKPALYAFDNKALIQLLEDSGCPSFSREDGKVFPMSLKAADVRNALLDKALALGTQFCYDTTVTSMQKDNDSFTVQTDTGEKLTASHLILCSGGAAWPQTGSDGSGYDLAKKLGHTILMPKPALASISLPSPNAFSACAGLGLKDIRLHLGKHNNRGDLLFTHQGLSGPLILDNSHLMNRGQTIHLEILPAANKLLPEMMSKSPKKSILSVLHHCNMAESLGTAILSILDIPPTTIAAELKAAQRHALINWLQRAPFTIAEIESLNTAMSDFGGAVLSEVNAKTMQSRIIPGLFLAGESLAYSLPTGGFSIQMAFSTGWLAGKTILNNI